MPRRERFPSPALRRQGGGPGQASNSVASDKQVVLAAVAGAHGVGGEVRLRAFSEKIDNLKRHKRLFVDENRPLTLVSLRGGGNGAIARFAEITDRNAAEVLRGNSSAASKWGPLTRARR